MNSLDVNQHLSSVVSSSSQRIVGSRTVDGALSSSSVSGIDLSNKRSRRMEDSDSDEDDEDEEDEDNDLFNASDETIASQLASAGPTGMAAAAAISSTRKGKRSHAFETNPSVRKRQQTRLLRKLKQNIDEYSLRVGQQAIVCIATPGGGDKSRQASFRAFGAKPLEDVVKNLRVVIMSELETALANQTPAKAAGDPTRYELPPLVIDGIPTPVEKMTQAQLRGFIPLMLKYSTGRGKPGWGKDGTQPPWWPLGVPWANIRMDARRNDEKQKVSWTHALRDIVNNCYRYHGREDLLPSFSEDTGSGGNDDVVNPRLDVNGGCDDVGMATVVNEKPDLTDYGEGESGLCLSAAPNGEMILHQTPHQTAVQTSSNTGGVELQQWSVSNGDGSVSIIQIDPNNPIITLPDGSQAQVHVAHEATAVHTLAEVAATAAPSSTETHTITGVEPHHVLEGNGHFVIASEDGQAYPLNGGMITVPVPASVYQAVMATNVQGISTGGGGIIAGGTQIQVAGSGVLKMEPRQQVKASPVQLALASTPANHGTLTITPMGASTVNHHQPPTPHDAILQQLPTSAMCSPAAAVSSTTVGIGSISTRRGVLTTSPARRQPADTSTDTVD